MIDGRGCTLPDKLRFEEENKMNKLNVVTMETMHNILFGQYWKFDSRNEFGDEKYINVISGIPVLLDAQAIEDYYSGSLPE